MLVMPDVVCIMQEIFRLAMNAVCCHQTLDILRHGYERTSALTQVDILEFLLDGRTLEG